MIMRHLREAIVQNASNPWFSGLGGFFSGPTGDWKRIATTLPARRYWFSPCCSTSRLSLHTGSSVSAGGQVVPLAYCSV